MPAPSFSRSPSLLREIELPIVPKPYGPIRYQDTPENARNLFVPQLNLDTYERSISLCQKARLYRRADEMMRHARQNADVEPSESTWESDMRADLFGEIRNDYRLAIDKTPVYFVDDLDSRLMPAVKHRIPDYSLGLSTVRRDVYYSRGPRSVDWPSSLIRERIENQTAYRSCGLIGDPNWGKNVLVFPWAVYEAKKNNSGSATAREQLHESMAVYLGMLHDLCRDPEDPNKYQRDAPECHQIFGILSKAQNVEVYRMVSSYPNIAVTKIWSGHVTRKTASLELVALVDQLHEYAVTIHREMVARHLKPWLYKTEQKMEYIKRTLKATGSIASSGTRLFDLHYARCPKSQPYWMQLERTAKPGTPRKVKKYDVQAYKALRWPSNSKTRARHDIKQALLKDIRRNMLDIITKSRQLEATLSNILYSAPKGSNKKKRKLGDNFCELYSSPKRPRVDGTRSTTSSSTRVVIEIDD
ncbi:hypothetical protein K432DRAFT_346972 [Lepidopterella palustris CBS 459.81]|uniref:Uncharacterized protein n=1 Tax=Lepidopterella palustris CBS 459.81 TaxID=1314670 RepID=A0A8E2EGR9_9PEZI|nr:hypothetical protein K432DRAFT_346972 [Lepidopterella palustris CBS 459.81]